MNILSAIFNNNIAFIKQWLLTIAENDLAIHIALHNAAFENRYKIVKLLLKNGADPNIKDTKDSTSLIYAINNGNLKMVKLLLKYGADVNEGDRYDFTPLNYAVDNRNLPIVKVLLKKGANIDYGPRVIKNSLVKAVLKNNYEITKYLLKYKADVNSKLIKKYNILHHACKIKSKSGIKMIKLLIKNNIKINTLDSNNMTALDYACLNNNYESAKYLFMKGAKINIRYNIQIFDLFLTLNDIKFLALIIKYEPKINNYIKKKFDYIIPKMSKIKRNWINRYLDRHRKYYLLNYFDKYTVNVMTKY